MKKQRNPNRRLSQAEVIDRIQGHSEITQRTKIVGAWVWVEFEEKPSAEARETLREIGFHWNRDRNAWQHPCGVFRKRSRWNPKDKYGEVELSDNPGLTV